MKNKKEEINMCGGVDGPGGPCEGTGTYSKTCNRCKLLIWNCKCSNNKTSKKRVNNYVKGKYPQKGV